MTSHDIPTRTQLENLMDERGSACVSIYLPTTPVTREVRQDRIELRNLVEVATGQMRDGGADEAEVTAVEELFEDLGGDVDFWAHQAHSLAVFATPAGLRTFRLLNDLTPAVEVSDRFHVKPLLRSVTFPQAAWVLALAKGGARLLHITAGDPPEEVAVPELPLDAWSTSGNKVVKAREASYVRQVDHALRSVLSGSDLPLILAATETIAALYGTVNTYPHLAEERVPGNAEEMSDAELAEAARTVLDDIYRDELDAIRARHDQLTAQGRSATDVSDIARLATMGAVDTVLVDIDASVPGSIDEETGAVTFDAEDDAVNYGVVDEIARRVMLHGGRVLAVRADDIPGGGPVAALLRYVP